MKQYKILIGLALFFTGIAAAYGADVSDEVKPDAIEARIRRHRMGELIVKAGPGADVHVKQLRHEFWFGAALS
jgi:hypothetical protein